MVSRSDFSGYMLWYTGLVLYMTNETEISCRHFSRISSPTNPSFSLFNRPGPLDVLCRHTVPHSSNSGTRSIT